MKKLFVMPLLAAVVAAGGAFATTGFGAEEEAYGRVGTQCMEGILLEPESCSTNNEGDRCQVEIGGIQYDAWQDAECENELFKPENR